MYNGTNYTFYEYSIKMKEDNEVKIYYGVITATDFKDATQELLDFYGNNEEDVINIRLENLDSSVLEFSKEAIREMRRLNEIV